MPESEIMSQGQTLEQAIEELKRRKREDPLKNVYTPHQHQETGHGSRANITLVVGGNRTGKTYMAVAEALLYVLGRSAYAETPDAPNTVWYTVPTSSVFEDAVLPVMEELVPWNKVESYDKRSKRFKFTNGSTLVIKTTDQTQKRLVGAAVDLVVCDEPVPKGIFRELKARTIDTGGRVLMVLTPVGDKADRWMWIRDDVYIPWETGERKDIDVIHMPIVDEEGNPNVPHISKEQIEQMRRDYPDPQVRAARMHGEFISRAGLVFQSFDSGIHEIPRFEVPDNYHQYLVCDPQYHRFAVLLFAVDENGNRIVTNEYFSQDEPLSKRARRIHAMVGPKENDIPMYVDYANPQDVVELNYHFNQIGADIGAVELPFNKRVEKMILRTHSMLEPSPDRVYPERAMDGKEVYGAPRLMFFNDLESTWEHDGQIMRTSRLIWEMKRLVWGNKNKPDKNSAGGADASDCMIYGCSVQASGRRPETKEQWKEELSERDVMLWSRIEEDRQRKDGRFRNLR